MTAVVPLPLPVRVEDRPRVSAPTREVWLLNAVELMRRWFEEAGKPLPPEINISINPRLTHLYGWCRAGEHTDDRIPHICLSADHVNEGDLTGPHGILETLLHELCHAALPVEVRHGEPFAKLAATMGLQKPWRSTLASEECQTKFKTLADKLGSLPEDRIHTIDGVSTLTTVPRFDYSSLEPEVSARVESITVEIRGLVKQTVGNVLAIGDKLLSAKRELGHGHFIHWLEAEFCWDPRTAQRYIQAAEWARDKNDTVSLLEPTALYLLSARSTPAVVQNEVLNRLKVGDRSASQGDITALIRLEKAQRVWVETEEEDGEEAEAEAKRRAEEERAFKEFQEAEEAEQAARLELATLLRERLGKDDLARVIELLVKTNSCDDDLLTCLKATSVADAGYPQKERGPR